MMFYLKRIIFFVVLAAIDIQSQGCAFCQTLSGRDIADRAYNRNDGQDAQFHIEMVLIDKNGQSRARQLDTYMKDYGVLMKSFIRFTAPADIENTSFLSEEVVQGDDIQYLYLPALGRSRRIVSSQKNLKFVNTDFTYEDMQRRKPDKDTHTLLREEPYNSWVCYVLESIPVDDSQYLKKTSWIDKESLAVVKVEYYDKKGFLSKRFTAQSMAQIEDIWTITEQSMEDLKDSHKTTMKVLKVQYNRGLSDDIFSQRNLERK